MDRPVKFFTACKLKGHKRVPSKRHVSVEIEVASAGTDLNISNAVCKWRGSIVRDGSLPEGGFEINTSPANGQMFANQIEEICSALSRDQGEVTQACGLHVHVSAQDYRYFELRRLILLYAHIENALFAMQPYSRRNSSYCMPCGGAYRGLVSSGKDCKKSIVQMVYHTDTQSVKNMRGDKYHPSRYTALNLHSWFYRGTIECRMAAGTILSTKIIPWGILWGSILDYAYTRTEKEILAKTWSTSGYDMLTEVAPTQEVKDYIKARTYQFKN